MLKNEKFESLIKDFKVAIEVYNISKENLEKEATINSLFDDLLHLLLEIINIDPQGEFFNPSVYMNEHLL